jgi:hypothetical protein
MKTTDVIHEGAPVGCDRLRIVRFSYFDFRGQSHDDGEIMVLDAVSDYVKSIFDDLYKRRFPIAKARLMDRYNGEDDDSLADNNTSAFNDRQVTGGNKKSLHAYGLAIDLNPVQNPFVKFDGKGGSLYNPVAGADYANRLRARPNKPPRFGMAEEVVDTFAANGFLTWGGYWDSPIDYQHFEVPRVVAECLADLSPNQSRKFFGSYVESFRGCRKRHNSRDPDIDRATCAAIGMINNSCDRGIQ